ncbi:ABC transporter ATP-binding protein [Noviherbaspirillum saxi]|uniref:sn-glycerol-3-phosphate ABC transporter ATP-binding protein UgpC n=1 Tax=Noviherbaspirillum saxi TaxID=2320863 RepID=A0A3A3FH47_9BURK|nr:sn-glycerol-3-phosphate ABC transporter ATP-binding protein UgpC [Noviherbaspirillum saxi]RJF91824.1 sn-glycerol-3-phosphate ABC transporter ATP-binding protein UgpC [Noviherbaspirillum saxi]
MTNIVLSQVSKRYGEQPVVNSLDLDMADGEFVVLVGPSGCGKSTTLRMLAGLEDVSSGTIHIGGRDVTMLQPGERNIAMVFQNYALYPHKTVYENLAFGLRMRKVPAAEIESKVRWAAQMLSIDALLPRKPRQLSGGQMQRVSLGRALVRSPEVFLLDEPLSNLDAKLRIRMREEIAQLHKRVGTNMVYVTHDQVEAMTLGDRIVIMNQGQVQQIGRPLDVYDAPANLFVAGFIGAPEMNLVRGNVQDQGGRLMFVAPGMSLGLPAPIPAGVRAGKEIVLGIRPEHAGMASDGIAAATVVLVEQLGAQTLSVLELDHGKGSEQSAATRVRVLTGRRNDVGVGDRVRLTLDMSRIHLFDAESGVNLKLS